MQTRGPGACRDAFSTPTQCSHTGFNQVHSSSPCARPFARLYLALLDGKGKRNDERCVRRRCWQYQRRACGHPGQRAARSQKLNSATSRWVSESSQPLLFLARRRYRHALRIVREAAGSIGALWRVQRQDRNFDRCNFRRPAVRSTKAGRHSALL